VKEEAQQPTPEEAKTHTFVVYDAKTGDLVHGHKVVVLPDAETPSEKEMPEEALRLASEVTDRKPDELRVLSVSEDELEPGFVYRVNPDTERLERSEGGEAAV
jgi:hypothetical protein